MVIGPSGAGKTSTLAALDAACYTSPVDDGRRLSLRHYVTGERRSQLSRFIVDWIADGRHPPATESYRDFMLEVATHLQGRGFRPSQLVVTRFHCTDSPGGALFPMRADLAANRVDAASRSALVAQAQAASSIIFVIDSTRPATDVIELNLQPTLDDVARSSPGEELPQPFGVRLLERLRLLRRPRSDRRTRLAASRFLILLTKVDALAHSYSRQLEKQGVKASPLEVANAMDPVALARELIGERNLRRIWGALGRRARLAVGLSSVTGFVRDAECRASLDQTFLEWGANRAPQERLLAWSSFGVYEALRFITTGECGGPVKQVYSEADLTLERALPLDSFPFTR
ncbi:hypothetical protein ACLESO_05545 [Pyxidicoccus sp. 3LG]